MNPTPEQQAAIRQVALATNARFSFDMEKGDPGQFYGPNEREYLRAEIQSFILTSMMEHPSLEG
jgi:hypothetical protein